RPYRWVGHIYRNQKRGLYGRVRNRPGIKYLKYPGCFAVDNSIQPEYEYRQDYSLLPEQYAG
ncbi:hypothetical protein ABTP95_21080, partial [Acinetobacter baumannii]